MFIAACFVFYCFRWSLFALWIYVCGLITFSWLCASLLVDFISDMVVVCCCLTVGLSSGCWIVGWCGFDGVWILICDFRFLCLLLLIFLFGFGWVCVFEFGCGCLTC